MQVFIFIVSDGVHINRVGLVGIKFKVGVMLDPALVLCPSITGSSITLLWLYEEFRVVER